MPPDVWPSSAKGRRLVKGLEKPSGRGKRWYEHVGDMAEMLALGIRLQMQGGRS